MLGADVVTEETGTNARGPGARLPGLMLEAPDHLKPEKVCPRAGEVVFGGTGGVSGAPRGAKGLFRGCREGPRGGLVERTVRPEV